MSFKDKSPDMQEFLNSTSVATFGTSIEAALKQGICVQCKQEALARRKSEAGKTEYGISGLCEVCWDDIVGGE